MVRGGMVPGEGMVPVGYDRMGYGPRGGVGWLRICIFQNVSGQFMLTNFDLFSRLRYCQLQ